ncbi:hypothetical protein Hdeb2414_s0027g00685021 [Helianthus debilis subsp. tardiflorus]
MQVSKYLQYGVYFAINRFIDVKRNTFPLGTRPGSIQNVRAFTLESLSPSI